MTTKAVARRAARSPWLAGLARVGFLSRALVYAVVAILAARLALGTRRTESIDPQGALETIAIRPGGRVLLVVLAVGFAAYALWRVGQVVFPTADDRGKPSKRWAHLGSALVYLGAFAATVGLLTGTAGDDRRPADVTAAVLGLPLGRWIVAAGGLALVASAGASVRRALTGGFRDSLQRIPAAGKPWADVAAVGGLFARATSHLLIGAFLLRAAMAHDASQSRGLDGALRSVSDSALGRVFLGVLAAGYLARSAFLVVEARYRKAT